MSHSLLKISIISLFSINSLSFAMETSETFDIQKFTEDIRRHIFVVAHPSIQNQLKRCSTSWHAIGTKQAPNMYQLVNDASFNPSQDDWRYIMMHAAFDKNIDVMNKVLNRTDRRNFDYDFGIDCLAGRNNKEKGFRLCDVYDFDALLNDDSGAVMSKKFKELDLKSNCSEGKPLFETSLFRACFAGDIDTVKQEVDKKYQSNKYYDCIVISLYNDNPYCIQELSSLIKHIVMDEIHLSLLGMAMHNNKKHAFRALVQYNIYGRLNEPIYIPGQRGCKTTVLDILNENTDISNLAEYIDLYKELGGKTWQEMKNEEEEKENTFCRVQ